jgi:hypothetical protein
VSGESVGDDEARTGLRVADWIALVLALGVATAVNVVTIGVIIDAIRSEGPGLSDNATQVLTTAFSGIFGVLGAYVGFRARRRRQDGDEE